MPNTIFTDEEINQMIDSVIVDNGPESITPAADNQLRKDIYANIKKLTGEKILISNSIGNGVFHEPILLIQLPELLTDRLINVEMLCMGIAFSGDGVTGGSANCIKQNSVYFQKLADASLNLKGNFYFPGSGASNIGNSSDLHAYLDIIEFGGLKYIAVCANNNSIYAATYTGNVVITISNL
jgi:hypothetical protein